MPTTVRDACKVREGAFDFVQGDQIEDLATLIREQGDGTGFFSRNVVTKGMDRLLRGVLTRLAGKGENAVYQLTQAMGGGKTHAMIALGLLARNEALRGSVVPDIAEAAGLSGEARIVALTGRNKPQRFLWGEIATQLGKAEEFERFWKDGPDAPDEGDWLRILPGQPTLIMLDELPPYFDYARTRSFHHGSPADSLRTSSRDSPTRQRETSRRSSAGRKASAQARERRLHVPGTHDDRNVEVAAGAVLAARDAAVAPSGCDGPLGRQRGPEHLQHARPPLALPREQLAKRARERMAVTAPPKSSLLIG